MTAILTSTADQVLRVTLNRPKVHNAINPEMITELTTLFYGLREEKNLRAVILAGEGKSFCAGADLGWMKASLKDPEQASRESSQKLSQMFEAIYQCPLPTLAHVHGNIMGGGLGLVAVCDIVTAESSSKFCLSEVKLGLVPAVISIYLLQKISRGQVTPLMLTAESFSAEKAASLGLINHYGDKPACHAFIKQNLAQLLDNGPEALRASKALLHDLIDLSWEEARQRTIEVISTARRSTEGQEGMQAFFAKRDPSWRKK